MATQYGPCPNCLARRDNAQWIGDPLLGGEPVTVPAGRVCFDCAYRTPQEREAAYERLQAKFETPWRRFPLESLGLLAAAVWSACHGVKEHDTDALIASAVFALFGLRLVRMWFFSLGVLFALTCCGGGEFHAGVDEGGSGGAALLGGDGGASQGSAAGSALSGGTVGAAGAPSSAAGAGGATARGGNGGASSVGGVAGESAAGSGGGMAGLLANAGAAGKGECLAGWKGSSCDTCTNAPATGGESCAEALSCYQRELDAGMSPFSCDWGTTPETNATVAVARAVYACRCP